MVFLGYWLLPCHPFSPLFCPLEVGIGESPDDQSIHDAIVTSCVFFFFFFFFFFLRTQTTPVSQQTRRAVSVKFWNGSVALTRGGGGVVE